MEWENKTTLCQLANEGKTKEFFDFVVEHLDEFDGDEQAQDMLFTAIDLTEVKNFKEQSNKIFEKAKIWRFDSFKTALRAAYFETVLKEE